MSSSFQHPFHFIIGSHPIIWCCVTYTIIQENIPNSLFLQLAISWIFGSHSSIWCYVAYAVRQEKAAKQSFCFYNWLFPEYLHTKFCTHYLAASLLPHQYKLLSLFRRDDDILYVAESESFIPVGSTIRSFPCMNSQSASLVTPNDSSTPLCSKLNTEWVTLNVGGKYFTTSRSTLMTKEPMSMLARLVNDSICLVLMMLVIGHKEWLLRMHDQLAHIQSTGYPPFKHFAVHYFLTTFF